ncbi:Amphiphysin, putative [Pediculus humanus corporis]|uniref:Amphiphysin, putative n=1 Tax=Pediculus humanus subsp. corporis TaxID=121224 RepID=E0VZ19_PEDHC|nr:Amphiphysin, putative [Pediculus humanus corporis]EEB18625.1 Amphiphysin, putative [Pediculus humanus corporis]
MLSQYVLPPFEKKKKKILQNLGKVDRTADEIFDDHLHNFTRQQTAATRLQKEFNNYIRCIRAVQTASKTLMEAVSEIYENQWPGHDLLCNQMQNIEMLWQDFSHKLGDQVLIPLNTYQSQFPEMRKKIDKRGRKLVDYDSQRHNFQSLQSNPRKKDDVKVQKAKESLEEAKRTYEMLNSELHDELPALYDSRVIFLVSNLQTLFTAEQVFHSETAKVYNELEAILDKLATDSQRGPGLLKKQPGGTSSSNFNVNNKVGSSPSSPTTAPVVEIPPPSESPKSSPTSAPRPSSLNLNNGVVNGTGDKSPFSPDVPVTESPEGDTTDTTTTATSTKNVEELYDIPVGEVKATYKYNREDSDELSFDVDEIIRVVEYDDPEEQVLEFFVFLVPLGFGDGRLFHYEESRKVRERRECSRPNSRDPYERQKKNHYLLAFIKKKITNAGAIPNTNKNKQM